MAKRFYKSGFFGKNRTARTFLISLLLCLVLVFACACGNDSSSSSSSAEDDINIEITDVANLVNGSFEFYVADATLPYTSSTAKWSRTYDYIVGSSTDNSSSSSNSFKSGVTDTADDAYAAMLEYQKLNQDSYKYLVIDDSANGNSNIDAEKGIYTDPDTGVEYTVQAVKNDNDETVYYFNPRTPRSLGYTSADVEYEISGDNDSSTDDDDEVAKAESYITNTKLLMIHNRNTTAKQGTAQYYKSSTTVTVAAGETAKLSFWVNTYGLDSVIENSDYGAYIRVDQSLNSTALDKFYIKNINTDGQWKQYSIYFDGNQYADTTLTIYLGLGMGSKNLKAEHCEGFAFFDDVVFETTANDDEDATPSVVFPATTDKNMYEAFMKGESVKDVHKYDCIFADGLTFTANEKGYDETSYAISYAIPTTAEATEIDKFFDGTFKLNKDVFKQSEYGATEAEFLSKVQADGENIIAGCRNLSDILTSLSIADKNVFDLSGKAIYFNFKADYDSSYTYTKQIDVAAGEYYAFSFYVNANSVYSNGLTVNINDLGLTSAIDDDNKSATAIVSSTSKTDQDTNGGWVRYFVLINNTAENSDGDTAKRSFELEISFGPTSGLITDRMNFPEGYAIVAGFEVLTDVEEDNVTVTTNINEDNLGFFSSKAKTVSLSLDLIDEDSTSSDSYNVTTDYTKNLKYGISSYVSANGNKLIDTTLDSENVVGGVFNTEYIDVYDELTAEQIANLKFLEAIGDNEYVQALLVVTTAEKEFGYTTSKTTISAGTTAKFSVNVRVFDGATATVRLVDEDGKLLSYEYGTTKFDYQQTVTKNADGDNEWTTVTFYVVAGENDSLTVRFQVLGSEDGMSVYDSFEISTSATATVDTLTAADEIADRTGATTASGIYYVANVDENGSAIVSSGSYSNGDKYEVDVQDRYEVKYYYSLASAETKTYIVYANYIMIDHDEETVIITDDSSDSTSTSESTSTSDETSQVKWLAISSLVIAIALIIALIGIVVRMAIKKYRANKVSVTAGYDRESRERAQKSIEKRSSKATKSIGTKKDSDDDDEDDEQEPIETVISDEDGNDGNDGEEESSEEENPDNADGDDDNKEDK